MLLGVFLIQSCIQNKQPSVSQSLIIDANVVSVLKEVKIALNKQNKLIRSTSFVSVNETNKDNLSKKPLASLARKPLQSKDSVTFYSQNKNLKKEALSLCDDLKLAQSYSNLASFNANRTRLDSAYFYYYKAKKIFQAEGNLSETSKMLFEMANIQFIERDYTSSEILLYQAISKLKKVNESFYLFKCYNLLGSINLELGEFDKSLSYYNKAIVYLEEIQDDDFCLETVFNNIGVLYHTKRDYSKASTFFYQILERYNLEKLKPDLYANVIDNLAYSSFLSNDTVNVKNQFLKALSVRERIDDSQGIVISKLHLAEVYLKSRDTLGALKLANESALLATQINSNRDYLIALKLLSEIDVKKSNTYLKQYITLNDYLFSEERRARNKYERIRFETDQYIKDKQKLESQKVKILIASGVLLFTFLMLYLIKQQHSKYKTLITDSELQESNAEIYSLIIRQQENLEKGRLEERHRIAEDIHDGILSRLFATRLNLGFLDLKGTDKTLEEHEIAITELQEIEKEIRAISHNLKSEIFNSEVSFKDLIESLLNKKKKYAGYSYQLTFSDNILWALISDEVKINIYRILQETMQNINKYAKAKNVKVSFDKIDKTIKLDIEDDGLGFDVKRAKKGIGISNINSRLNKINGKLHIESSRDGGTKIHIQIILKD